jgi:hypothetical protein
MACDLETLLQPKLGYWVKPWSTMWFSHSLFGTYGDERWIHHFMMIKRTFFDITHQVTPLVEKQNTKYWLVLLVEIQVVCTIYKLAQGMNYLTCSELFAIGWSLVSFVICEVI